MATARKYDLYSDRFRAEAYATFAQMREEDPVLCQRGIEFWRSIRRSSAGMGGSGCS